MTLKLMCFVSPGFDCTHQALGPYTLLTYWYIREGEMHIQYQIFVEVQFQESGLCCLAYSCSHADNPTLLLSLRSQK